MGMGEPAHNLDNVLEAIDLLGTAGAVGHKNLVFSTVGDARVFERLPHGRVKPALALSLHSTKAALRAELLPRAPRCEPADLVAAGEAYARFNGYPIQYQWTLIEGVNDGDDEVEGIVALLAGKYAMMNFIPYNAVDGLALRRPPWERAAEMARALHRRGVLTKLRQFGRTGRGRRLRAAARARGAAAPSGGSRSSLRRRRRRRRGTVRCSHSRLGRRGAGQLPPKKRSTSANCSGVFSAGA